jgi:hypothetical protein
MMIEVHFPHLEEHDFRYLYSLAAISHLTSGHVNGQYLISTTVNGKCLNLDSNACE